jgi:hypothetical protein
METIVSIVTMSNKRPSTQVLRTFGNNPFLFTFTQSRQPTPSHDCCLFETNVSMSRLDSDYHEEEAIRIKKEEKIIEGNNVIIWIIVISALHGLIYWIITLNQINSLF